MMLPNVKKVLIETVIKEEYLKKLYPGIILHYDELWNGKQRRHKNESI